MNGHRYMYIILLHITAIIVLNVAIIFAYFFRLSDITSPQPSHTFLSRYIMRVRMDSCVTPKRASQTSRSPPLKQWKLEVDAAHAITFGGVGQVDGYFKCPNIRWPREACDTAWYDIAFVIGRVFASAFIPTLESAFIYPWQPEDWAKTCVKERGGSNLHSKGTLGLTISAECVLAMHARSIGPV